MSQPFGKKQTVRTNDQMDKLRREQEAYFKANPDKDPKNRPLEASEAKDLCYFVVARYTKGSFRGMFSIAHLITEDAEGKPLKKPERKKIADGVDMVVGMAKLEAAIRRRVYR